MTDYPLPKIEPSGLPKVPITIVLEYPLTITGVCNECGDSWTREFPGQDYRKLDALRQRYIRRFPTCEPCSAKFRQEFSDYEANLNAVMLDQQRAEFTASSGIRGKYLEPERDLAHFDTIGGKYSEQLSKCYEWLERFDINQPHGSPSIVFFSEGFGVGKTHLASSLLKASLTKLSKQRDTRYNPIHFTTAETALRHVHAGQSFSAEEKEEDVYRHYTTVELLCLDDIGKEAPSKDQASFYYSVINGRYDLELPIILTANVHEAKDIAQAVGGAAMSRLQDMAAGFWIDMNGHDYRPIEGKRRIG